MSKVVQILSIASGLSETDTRSILASAPVRYKTYLIPKRNGGSRQISQPAREVKFLQKVFSDEVLSKLYIHEAAMAYRRNRSIKDNAAAHAGSGAIIKFDFSNFFPSITATDWKSYCEKFSVFENEEDINLTCNLLFRRSKYGSILRLAIGAPSSPILSNVIMADFDKLISELVAKHKVSYTRYADDLTFSAKRAGNLSEVERILRNVLQYMPSPRLRINEGKTVLATKKYRRVVTGLVLTDDGEVSLGRDRKRVIRESVHRYTLGLLDDEQAARLSGLLAFVNAVEPSFLDRLVEVYGLSKIEEIRGRFKKKQLIYKLYDNPQYFSEE